MTRLVVVLMLVLVVPLLMGATCTLNQAISNMPSRIDMHGTYAMGQGEFLFQIEAVAVPDGSENNQEHTSTAQVDQMNMTWTGYLTHQGRGVYRCRGRLWYFTGGGFPPTMFWVQSEARIVAVN